MSTMSTILIPIPPKRGTEARGRNGWFRPVEARIKTVPVDYSHGPCVELSVSSTRPADLPPIMLWVDPATARAIARALETAAEDAEALEALEEAEQAQQARDRAAAPSASPIRQVS